jgi:hypothetical protein
MVLRVSDVGGVSTGRGPSREAVVRGRYDGLLLLLSELFGVMFQSCRSQLMSRLALAAVGDCIKAGGGTLRVVLSGRRSPEDLIGVGGSDGVSNLGRNAPRRPHPGTESWYSAWSGLHQESGPKRSAYSCSKARPCFDKCKLGLFRLRWMC